MASLGVQFVPEQLRDEVLAKLMALPENKVSSFLFFNLLFLLI